MSIDKITRAAMGNAQYEREYKKALLEDKVCLLFRDEKLKPMFIAERLGVTKRYVQKVLSRRGYDGRRNS